MRPRFARPALAAGCGALLALGAGAATASAFPTTTTPLDAFNRAGGALSGTWSAGVLPAATGAPVLGSNRIQFPATGWSSARWTASTYAGAQEAFITKTSPGNVGVAACVTNAGTSSAAGYALVANGSGALTLTKYVAGVGVPLFTNHAGGVPVLTWDSVGIAVTPTTVEAWTRDGSGAWTKVREVTDAAAATCSGAIGVVGMGASADDFGGGAGPTTPPPPPPPGTVTAAPASDFTDSVGMNLALTYGGTEYDNQDRVESLLSAARIRHVRTPLERPDLARSASEAHGHHDTNAVALLGRAGVRSVIIPGPTLPQLYLDDVNRVPRSGTSGWQEYFENRLQTNDIAQQWLVNSPYPTRITGHEGVNEPNLRWNGTRCVNWMSKTADFQQRMIDRLAGTSLASSDQIAPPLVVQSPSLCGDGPSSDPWRALGRFTTPTGVGFTAGWNTGWATPSSLTPSAPWFTATAGSLASKVGVANLHAYPGRSAPQRMLTDDYWRVGTGGPYVCDTPKVDGDQVPNGGPKSCAAHEARTGPGGSQKPIYLTETGYRVSNSQVISESARGVYTPRLLLENYRAGIDRTYLFELLNGNNNGLQLASGGATSTTYGFNALRRLQFAIGNGDVPGPGDVTGQLGLTVEEIANGAGTPPDAASPVRHLLFAEKDGSYSLALWPSDEVVNPSNGAATPPPERRVRLTLASPKRISAHPIDPTSSVDVETGTLLAPSATTQEVALPGGHALVIKLR